jgi:hypothetical protein
MWAGILVSRLTTVADDKFSLAGEFKMGFHALLTQIVKFETGLLRLTDQ